MKNKTMKEVIITEEKVEISQEELEQRLNTAISILNEIVRIEMTNKVLCAN